MIFLIFLLSIVPPEYRTFDETQEFLDSIISLNSHIAMMETLNRTAVDSNPILMVKLSDNPLLDEVEPSILIVGVHHAEELLGLEISLDLIEDLLKNYGYDTVKTNFIEQNEIYIIPVLNPDGHQVVTSGTCEVWRKNKRDNNSNGMFDYTCGYEGWGDGVDLNRNYDYLFEIAGSSSDTSEYYRGPYPFSEPETRSIKELCERENFIFAISYHSARTGWGEVIYYPWRDGAKLSPDFPFISEVAESLALNIIKDDSSGPYISIVTGRNLGGFFRNWIYTNYGTLPFLIEVADTTIPSAERIPEIVQGNLNGIYYLLRRMERTLLKGVVRDSITGIPLRAEARILGIDTLQEIKHWTDADNGDFYRILSPGTYYLLVSSMGYENKIVPFSINGGERTTLYVNLYPSVRDTFPEDIYITNNFTDRNISLVFWVKKEKTSGKFLIFDISGRRVLYQTLGEFPPGFYREELPISLPQGLHFGTLNIGNTSKKQKILILKP